MSVMIDSSAWVEFLRGTANAHNEGVRRLVRTGAAATCDPVMLEVLAGARDERHAEELASLLDSCTSLPQERGSDVEEAASMYRTCRRFGETPRVLSDCLIAAIAVRHDVPVLHRDRDFDVLARHTALRVAAP